MVHAWYFIHFIHFILVNGTWWWWPTSLGQNCVQPCPCGFTIPPFKGNAMWTARAVQGRPKESPCDLWIFIPPLKWMLLAIGYGPARWRPAFPKSWSKMAKSKAILNRPQPVVRGWAPTLHCKEFTSFLSNQLVVAFWSSCCKNRSMIDIDRGDSFPPAFCFDMRSYYWHNVKSKSKSISVWTLFTPSRSLSDVLPVGCHSMDMT